MQVTIFVGAGKLCITPVLPFDHVKAMRNKFTFVLPGFEMTTQHKLYGWDGAICLFKRGQELPQGCLYRAKHTLQNLGHKVDVVFGLKCAPKGEIKVDDFELDSWQVRAVERALECRYGVIVAPMRAGKTAISAALLRAVGHYPAWVITDGTDLVLQTRNDIARHLSRPIGIYSEGGYAPQDITVASYAALRSSFSKRVLKDPLKVKRNREVRENWKNAKIILLDECHHAATDKFGAVLRESKCAAFQIGLSATPHPGGVAPLDFESKVGCIISKIPYKTLIEQGRLAKPLIIMYDLPYAWYSTYLPTYDDVVVSNLIDNQMRNRFICELSERLKKQGKTCFIKVTRLEHGVALNNMIPGSIFVNGSMRGQTRKDIYKALQEKDIYCVIATVGKEGLNIPSLDVVINAEGSKSAVANKQKMRSLTASAGKTYGIIIDFLDKGRYLTKHSKKRLKLYKSLKGFEITTRKVPKEHFPMEGTRWQAKLA
jgi:superfamily II DNA or RNA helicase